MLVTPPGITFRLSLVLFNLTDLEYEYEYACEKSRKHLLFGHSKTVLDFKSVVYNLAVTFLHETSRHTVEDALLILD